MRRFIGAVALVLLPVAQASGQQLRGWTTTALQAVELRSLGPSSSCSNTPCLLSIADDVFAIGMQDLELTAWGFGVTGLSARAFVRARTPLGTEARWPRSDDPVDVLLAHLQWARGAYTIRAGRQETMSGLGFSSFDGVSLRRRSREAWLEAYTGRSLAQGLRSPANDALAGVEDFLPDQGVWLFGAALGGRAGRSTGTVRYHRELLTDRSGLASERASVDVATRTGRLRWTGSLDWDFGLGRVGKGELSATTTGGEGRWLFSSVLRRYVPYFSLSTIWGFFEPVAYHEAELRARWSASPTLVGWAAVGWRRYGDAGAIVVLRPLEDTGWRGSAGVGWQWAPAWRSDGAWRLEWGPGGFLHAIDVGTRWSHESGWSAYAGLSSFQQIEQYRLGDGGAWGGRLSVGLPVSERMNVESGVSLLRYGDVQGATALRPGWTQSRGWARVRVKIGSEPSGVRGVRR